MTPQEAYIQFEDEQGYPPSEAELQAYMDREYEKEHEPYACRCRSCSAWLTDYLADQAYDERKVR